MAQPNVLDIQVEEEYGPLSSIARLSTTRTAFVGRTLRGPVNRPVLIKNFTHFQQLFGGLWQPSTLGYAVEHFFDNGGGEALIVRVVNGARPVTVTLAAGPSTLTLQALRPGTREFLRASVDYDNLDADSSTQFNLTVQRVRVQGSAQVEDQEIFQQLSVSPDEPGYVGVAFAESQLIALAGAVPMHRPNRTVDPASGLATAYVVSNSDGDDGAPLTDYDVIGSELERSGVFALEAVGHFNLLCIPPLSREQDVGPGVWVVAARYCKQRRALFIVDPPAAWHTADDAIRGMRSWEFANENCLMYFPRILAQDKLRGHFEAFAPCGAVAGMLARSDDVFPVWAPQRPQDAILRPGYRPSCLIAPDRRLRLASMGVNTLQAVRSARLGSKPRTLAAGSAGAADWQSLHARRLALFILNCVERGTRWAALAQPNQEVAEAVGSQVRAFFEGLHEAGAFGTRTMEESFCVICDSRAVPGGASTGDSSAEFQFVIGFAAARPPEFHGFRISHVRAGSTVQPVSLSRLRHAHYSPVELEWVERLASQLQ